MTNISHNLNPPSTGDTRPGSEDALLATARENIEAGDNAGREFYRKAADALVTTWKTHKTPQRKMAEAVGRSQSWVAQLLQWHREGCPVGGPFLRVNVSSRTTQKKLAASKSSTSKRKTIPAPANQVFEAAATFFKAELAGLDNATFDHVMKMFAEWRQAAKTTDSKAPTSPAVVKIGKETVKSFDNFGEDAKRQIAAAVAGNDTPPEISKEGRSAYYAASEEDDLGIPTFLRREPVLEATA